MSNATGGDKKRCGDHRYQEHHLRCIMYNGSGMRIEPMVLASSTVSTLTASGSVEKLPVWSQQIIKFAPFLLIVKQREFRLAHFCLLPPPIKHPLCVSEVGQKVHLIVCMFMKKNQPPSQLVNQHPIVLNSCGVSSPGFPCMLDGNLVAKSRQE